MKVAIIGSGAMGSLYGGKLSEKNDVYLIDVWHQHIDTINKEGLTTIENEGNKIKSYPKGFYSSSGLPIMDLVLIFVKSINTKESIMQSINLFGPNTIVLTLQNGYGNDLDIMEAVKAENVIVGTTNHGCTIEAPGIIYHAGSGFTTIGSVAGNKQTAEMVAAILSDSGFEVKINENIQELIFHKLLINTGINAITAIFNVDNEMIRKDPNLWSISKKIVIEAIEISKLKGLNFDQEEIFRDIEGVAIATAKNHSSMRTDVLKKRQTEIDKINGAFVAIARANGADAPYNEIVTEMVKFLESQYLSQ